MTTKSLAQAIRKYTKGCLEDKPEAERDYEQEARWFAAYQIASDMYETYTIKDWAHFVLNGMERLTETDVLEHFNDPDEGPMSRLEIMHQIRNFYGVYKLPPGLKK